VLFICWFCLLKYFFQRPQERLVLLAWLNGLFGYRTNRELLTDMKEAAEGFDAGGRSFIYHRLVARGGKVKSLRLQRLPRSYAVQVVASLCAFSKLFNIMDAARHEPV